MSELSALEGRLTDALKRISAGVEALDATPAPAAAAPADSGLEAQLAEERTANAQLEERVKALKVRQDNKIAELEARVTSYRKQLSDLDGELQTLRTSNADLSAMNEQLRGAVTSNVAEPELVNRALMAELDALRAQRSADAAEADAIIADLKSLVEGA